MRAHAAYHRTQWDEQMVESISSRRRISRVTAELFMTGEVEGKAALELILFYEDFDDANLHKAEVRYLGLLHFAGSVHGHHGGFVMEDRGYFKEGTARSEVVILTNSGIGSLKGIQGKGHYRASADSATFEMEYELNPSAEEMGTSIRLTA
jgi:hypothetical protein